MDSAEQPLKKRKLYERTPPPPPPPENEEPPPPPPQTPPPLSHEEILRRRRNHEEIRSVYESYKAIKRCVVSSWKHARHVPEIEQAYLSLISSSRGCASVHRVLSEFIPRYAKYCPTALEAAAQVIINMHNCNLPVITRGEDADGVSFDTATNCIVGLVDICHTASLEAPSSSVITGICSTVFLNVVTFFASSIDGNDILQIVDKESLKMQVCVETFSQLKQRVLEENASPFVKLLRLKALCFLKIFFLCPKDVLEACFGLFSTPHSADGVCREAKYVLRQLSDKLDSGHEIPLLDGNEVGLMKQCLLGEVLQRNHSLKKWIFSRYKRLRKFASPEAVSQVTVAFEGIFESFTELVKAQDVEESDEEGPNPSKYTGGQYLVHRISDQCSPLSEVSGRDSASQIIDKSCRDESPNKIPRQYLKRHGSILSHENDRDHHSNSSSEQLLSPLLEKPSEIKSGPFEQGEKVVHHRTPKSKSSDGPPGGGQVIWFSDGDPAALYVFSATRQIWLGSLSPDISEASVRHELERFGPIENFSFFPVKGFALAEYRSITDATKAREFMQRYSPWGYPVRVKFIDVGLGTRGSIGGVAIGSSCHVFVGNVFNHWTKDEILQEMMKVVSRGPRVVADISSEGTLLLEFDSPEEAARGMACIRQLRRGIGNATDMSSTRASYWNSAAAPVGNVLGSTCNTMLGSPHGQTGGSPNNRMNIAAVPSNMKMEGAPPEFVSPRAAFEQGFSIQGGQMTHSNMISSGCADTPGIGFTRGSMPAPPEQMWCWNPEVENHSASGSLACTPIATHGPAIPPPHSIQPPPYNMQPVYPPPTTNSWDPHSLTHYPPRPMPTGPHSSTVPLPFVQPSVTSLSQIPGSGIQPYSQMAPMPIMVPPHSAMMPPQPVMPPPIPSSPPPPPPPPPDAGPPPPSTGLSSASSVVESLQIQWQGTLAKSGVHYCTVHAHRIDSDSCKYLVPVSEPTGWPVKLDMTKRTDFGHVQAAFANTPPSRREVCELVPSSAADHKGFQDFISYLKQRGCAGVIKIPSAKSLWARLLFILPCSPEACMMLSVKSRASDCLFAVVLPKEANSECA